MSQSTRESRPDGNPERLGPYGHWLLAFMLVVASATSSSTATEDRIRPSSPRTATHEELRCVLAHRDATTAVIARVAEVCAACLLSASASAARLPTTPELVAIRQTIFDYVHSSGQRARPVIRIIRVTTHAAARPVGRPFGYYGRFAAVGLEDKRVGRAAALLGYWAAPLPGWRVLELGTGQVGCDLPARMFRGRKAAVLRDLGFNCP